MPRLLQSALLSATAGVLALAASAAFAGRFEGYTQKAAQGPKMRVVSATYFGGDGVEEFVAAQGLADNVVAFGNLWGPQLPDGPAMKVLGKGAHSGTPAIKTTTTKGGDKTAPDESSPDRAGMIVVFDSKLSAVKSSARFDWGVASLETGIVANDGQRIIISGRCGPNFASLAPLTQIQSYRKTDPAPADPKKKGKGPVTPPGHSFIAKLSPAGDKIDWIWVLEDQGTAAPRLWTDKAGNVYGEAGGLNRISPDGKTLDKLSKSGNGGQVGVRAVDPDDGSYYFGGDRNTHTGKEPWRQPFFYKITPKGEKLWHLWEWPSRGLRDGSLQGIQGDVSDSAIRWADWTPDGNLIVGCWSDGGNTVLGKQGADYTKPVKRVPFGMDGSGMKNANSLTHFIKLDPKTQESKWIGLWMGYCPQNFVDLRTRGAPNGCGIDWVCTLNDGSFILTGRAGSGLIQTPGAFLQYPDDGQKYGSAFAAVWDKDMANLLFSSYLPGCENVVAGRTKNGVAIVSRSKGEDNHVNPDGSARSTPSPVVNALQAKKRGAYDAHLILLELPEGQ